MTPTEIRAIRGSLSRPAFARLLGVTALTVLRWELPDGSKEARRPRAKMIEALRKLAAEGVPASAKARAAQGDDDAEVEGSVEEEASDDDVSEPAALEACAPSPTPSLFEDMSLVVAVLDKLHAEGWRRAEDDLLDLLSSCKLQTESGRALATLGLAQARLLRLDPRSALTTILPILAEADRGAFTQPVRGRAHLMAALAFASPDPRTFDAGRVNAHAAQADALLEPDAVDPRVLLATARTAASRFLGAPVMMRTYEAHKDLLDRASSPIARFMAAELHARAARIKGDHDAASRHGDIAIALAQKLGVEPILLALLADRAWRRLHGAVTPSAVLEVTKEIRARAAAANLPPIEPVIRAMGCEAEVLLRLGRFDEAEAVVKEGLALAKPAGIPRYSLAIAACHLHVYKNRPEEIDVIADGLADDSAGRPNANLYEIYARATAANQRSDHELAAELAEKVVSAPEMTPGIDYLLHDTFFEYLIAVTLLRDRDRIREVTRRFGSLLEERPSVWHQGIFRRLEGFDHLLSGRVPEARQKLESTLATFTLVGDVVQMLFANLSLGLAARASGSADAEQRIEAAKKELQRIGLVARPAILRDLSAAASSSAWTAPTLMERVAVAVERLSVRGLPDELAKKELGLVLTMLFPGREIVTGSAVDEADDEAAEITDPAGLRVRAGVRGALDPEQRAALRVLSMITAPAIALARGPAPQEVENDAQLPGFVAAAPATRRLKREIAQLSRSHATILVTGESGSGKEVVARGVHDLSNRAAKPYATFNCASVPRDLFEGQLFGYKRGAFTGAVSDNPGVIRAADGGTLFLDEIGELPLDTQPKLLRFLENGEVLPLGEQKPRRVDVRVLAATHRDLGRLVREGLFREDLYYRLNVVPLQVPPLRERREDIAAIARLFVEKLAPEGQEKPELGADAVHALESHTWPGNVRELRNVIERAMAYAPVPSVLRAEHLRIGI